MTDLDPRLTVLSIDGIGAYDHVFRSACLEKLLEVEAIATLVAIRAISVLRNFRISLGGHATPLQFRCAERFAGVS